MVIPACNEETRINSTLVDYATYLRSQGLSFEIIVEMDGCTDGTAKLVKDLSSSYPEIRHIEFVDRLGKGGGLIKGFQAAQGRFVGFVDADGSVSPRELVKLLEAVRAGADCAIASRRTKGSVIVHQSMSRKVLGKAFNLMVRGLFAMPYKDTQCGAKVFRREALKKVLMDVHVNGFVFDVVILYLTQKNHYRIREVGVVWEERPGSKVDMLHTTIDMFLSIIKLRIFYSPFRFLMPPQSRKKRTEKETTECHQL